MISIAKLGGAGQASSYYDKADYYTKGQEKADISSKFSGEMAKDLKLEGAIDKKEFTKLLNGITPDGQQLGTTRGGKNEHTPGWDLTFSAPKSLSILALVGNDKALIKAHQASVDSTLKYLEKNILKGRIHASGQTIPVDLKKALFAQFTHTTSRKLDPQLHTHSVLLNMGVDKFGNTRSIDSRAIYDNSMLLGQIYRNELARHAKELGYNVVWDAKKGLFEIGGVDEKLLKNFSKRSEEIRQIASEKGVDSAKDLEKITLATRENKKNISGDEVTNSWDKQVTELNLDPSKLVDSAKEHSKKYENQNAKRNMFGGKFSFKKESIDEKAMFGVQKAVEHLSYYDSAFKEKDLLKEVLLFTREHVGIEKITESLDKLKKEGLVIESNSHEGMLTTKEAINEEKKILDIEKNSRDTVPAISDSEQINKLINANSFTAGQEAGFRHLLLNTDRFTAIQGYAGVGKTYMLGPFVDLAKQSGYEVKAVAPMGKAAIGLGQSLGVQANTLKSLLMDFEKDKKLNPRKDFEKGNVNEIYIIDESSTINTPDMLAFKSAVEERGGRAIFAGDNYQQGGVERGNTSKLLEKNGMSTSYNTDIVRQHKDSKEFKAINLTYKRQFREAMNVLSGQTLQEPDRDKRLEKFADAYVQGFMNNEDFVGVVFDNASIKELTPMIREGLKTHDKIGKNELSVDTYYSAQVDGAKKSMAQFYETGMVVRFLQPYKKLKVERDSYYEVVGSNTREVTLSDGKRTFKWQPDKVGGNNKNGGVQTYDVQKRDVTEGDIIRFKDKNDGKGYKNGTEAKIISIKDGVLKLQEKEKGEFTGKEIIIDPKKHREMHFEHAYLMSGFASQGVTAMRGQVLLESYRRNLLNDSSYLVGISRVKENLSLFVDSTDEVIKAVEQRSGIKQSALDHQIENVKTDKAMDNQVGNVKADKAIDQNKSINGSKTIDTFVSKPAEQKIDMPKQTQREHTFLP